MVVFTLTGIIFWTAILSYALIMVFRIIFEQTWSWIMAEMYSAYASKAHKDAISERAHRKAKYV